nr:cytochrome P450 [Bradyrhizobium sp. SZCCHNR2035]
MLSQEHEAETRTSIVPPVPVALSAGRNPFRRLSALNKNLITIWGPRAYREDIVHDRVLGRRRYLLNTPSAIRHVLIENFENYRRPDPTNRYLKPVLGDGLILAEGAAWKHQRRTLAPAFGPRALAALTPHMLSAIGEAIDILTRTSAGQVDLRALMQRLTLEIGARTMFSVDMHDEAAELAEFAIEFTAGHLDISLLDLVLPKWCPSPRDISRALFRRRWRPFVARLIERRRGMANRQNPDLFDLMVNACDPDTGKSFNEEQLIDQVATMIITAYETTATTLFWALYLLALDTAAQDRLAAETGGGAIIETDDPAMYPFTRAVIAETMRLYPAAPLIARTAAGPDLVAGTRIARGDIIVVAPWILHRHQKLWQGPNEFAPDRFMPGAPAPDRLSYLPFGVGPRSCIGSQVAQKELLLSLIRIVGAFRVELVDNVPVLPIGGITISPDRSPMFRVTSRK